MFRRRRWFVVAVFYAFVLLHQADKLGDNYLVECSRPNLWGLFGDKGLYRDR